MSKRIRIIFLVLFIVTVSTMIGAFAYALGTPPPGDVPPGTIKALCIFLILAVLTELPFIFEVARSFRIEKGDFAISAEANKPKDSNEKTK